MPELTMAATKGNKRAAFRRMHDGGFFILPNARDAASPSCTLSGIRGDHGLRRLPMPPRSTAASAWCLARAREHVRRNTPCGCSPSAGGMVHSTRADPHPVRLAARIGRP